MKELDYEEATVEEIQMLLNEAKQRLKKGNIETSLFPVNAIIE